jgi:hypothetical protein
MVYTTALKAVAARHAGSSPVPGTKRRAPEAKTAPRGAVSHATRANRYAVTRSTAIAAAMRSTDFLMLSMEVAKEMRR